MRVSNRRRVAPIGAALLVALAGLAAALCGDSAAAPVHPADASIVFVCRNGVAMSVWSALTFDRLAAERGLPIRAVARAALPTYTEVPLRMKLALAFEGYRAGSYRPQVVSAADVRGAERVILIDTELPAPASSPGAAVESWDGFPPMREKYFESRAALRARVEALVERLAASRSQGAGAAAP
jgi:hypothetical protein